MMGKGDFASAAFFNGPLDEVRISTTARSQCWIETEYNNEEDPGTFVTLGGTTAVELMSFDASAADGAVDLSWQTGSELDNVGFHLYRSSSDSGPWTRLTSSLIPGLGSSPLGASYSWRDEGLVNGQTYYYRLEDVDTRSVSTLHGPVSAVPRSTGASGGGGGTGGAGGVGPDPGGEGGTDPDPGSAGGPGPDPGGDGGSDPHPRESAPSCPAWVLAASGSSPLGCETYGDPSATSLRVVSRSSSGAVLELETSGFVAAREPSGSVRAFIPGFDLPTDPSPAALPFRRVLVDAIAGRQVSLQSVVASSLARFPNLRPSAVGSSVLAVSADGTVRPSRRPAALRSALSGDLASEQARLAGVVFQGEDKRAVVEISPLRFDSARSALVLARRVQVTLSFAGQEVRESASGHGGRRIPRGVRRGAEALAHLYTSGPGLYAVRFSDLFPGGQREMDSSLLCLQKQGLPVAFHIEPSSSLFGPGSVLFFHADTASASTEFSSETAYELVPSRSCRTMEVVTASPSGAPSALASTGSSSFETDRIYQPGLLDAPDPWLWETLMGGVSSTETFSLQGVDALSSTTARLVVFLQGGSDAVGVVDHHVRLFLNDTPVGETRFDGAAPARFETTVPASLLSEGANTLTVENVGDTGVSSRVFLDRFSLDFHQVPTAEGGLFEGTWLEGERPRSRDSPRRLRLPSCSTSRPGATARPPRSGSPASSRPLRRCASWPRPATATSSPHGRRSRPRASRSPPPRP